MNTEDIQNIYNALLIEQDLNSPHRYLTESFTLSHGGILADIGCAEGILSLDLVELAESIFLFEHEDRWIEALNATFEPWKEKVNIIQKYVSNNINENETKLDAYFKNCTKEILIKIDVEGGERFVLSGAEETLKNKECKIICCTYHNQSDAEDFKFLLNNLGYTTEYSNGFMIWMADKNLKPPFFRKGLIRGWKK